MGCDLHRSTVLHHLDLEEVEEFQEQYQGVDISVIAHRWNRSLRQGEHRERPRKQ